MQFLSDWLQWFTNMWESIFDFLINTIKSLIDFISLVPSVYSFTLECLSYLPSIVSGVATISVIVAVVLLVLGRSNQSG